MTAILSAYPTSFGTILKPSGDTTGLTDAVAINLAVSKLPSTGGVITLDPVATWYIKCGQIVINATNVTIFAPGCYIKGTGNGDMIRMYDSSSAGSRIMKGGGIIGFPVCDGSLTTGNSTAFHAGDIFQLQVFMCVQNWNAGTTSKGVYLDNNYNQTEQLNGRIYAQSCSSGVYFDAQNSGGTANNSFDRMTLDVFIDSNGVGDGVTFNIAASVDMRLGIYGNFNTSTTQYAVLRFSGGSLGGNYAILVNGELNIGVELDDAVNLAPYTIFFGSGNNVIGHCNGVLDFALANTFTSTNTGNLSGFIGIVRGDPGLPVSLPYGITNLADTNQTVTPSAVTPLTSYALSVAAYQTYILEIYVPHLAAGAVGTFTLALGGPAINLASLDISLWTGTTLTAHTQNSASATLSAIAPAASQRSLIVTGAVNFNASGTLTVTGQISAGGSNVTIDIGGYMRLTPVSDP